MGKKLIIPGAHFSFNGIGHLGGGTVVVGDTYKQVGYYDTATMKLVNYMPAGTTYYVALIPIPSTLHRAQVIGMTPSALREIRFFTIAPTYSSAGTEVGDAIDVHANESSDIIPIPAGANYILLSLANSLEKYDDVYTNAVIFYEGRGKLPDGYTELEYVSTTSDAYIDTGISGDNDNLVLQGEFMITNFTLYGCIFGNYVTETDNSFRYIIVDNNGNARVNTNTLPSVATSIRYSLNTRFTLEATSKYVTIDGTQTPSTTRKGNINQTTIALGNYSASSPETRNIGLRIYGFQMLVGGESLLNYVPCKRNSDDAVGFYDFTNLVFKASDSNTSFVAGPTIAES